MANPRVLLPIVFFISIMAVVGGDSVTGTTKLDTSGQREFRGVWVATVANIDWPSSSHIPAARQQQELTTLFDKLKELNFNAVVFQVRPAGDAFYSSDIDPWSQYLTGTQGQAPDPFYDPLASAVAEAHKRGMDLHAWFNPYRARSGSTSKAGLSANHMCTQLTQYCYAYGKDLYMDPGASEVQTRLLNTIVDVVTRYDVDGIHFDDYFYPYPQSGVDFPDSHTYNAYVAGGGQLSHVLWRHHNVDWMVETVSQRIHSVRPWVKFGIAPFGIWKTGNPHGVVGFSSSDGQYADSRKWLQQGWVDYLSPQLYWKIDPPAQSFTALSDWWIQQNTQNHHLYTGMATYRISDSSQWPISEIQRQVTETRARSSHLDLGNIFFSAKYYPANTHGIADLFKNTLYARPALTPTMQWLHSDVTTVPTPNATVSAGTISWHDDPTGRLRGWALYKQAGSAYQLEQFLSRDTHSVHVGQGTYALTAVDRLARESDAVTIVVDTPLVG